MKLLVLCTDRGFLKLLEEALSHVELDFISEISRLKDLNYMKGVFLHDSYDVLVLSNMGIPMPLAMHHVSLLPEVRTYGALMLSGLLSETDRHACTRHQVETLDVPMKIVDLCESIDRLGRLARVPKPTSVSPRRSRRTARPARSAKPRKRA